MQQPSTPKPKHWTNPNIRLLLATLLPLFALGVQWVLWPWLSPFVWFLFFPTVFFSARLGGLIGGLISTLLSTFIVWYFFIPPQLDWKLNNFHNLHSVGLFLIMGYLFSDTQERLRQAQRKTEAALAETNTAKEQVTNLYQKNLELDELKTQFFANISHELRTPLTLIMSPLIQKLNNTSLAEQERHDTEMMLRNARLLYRHVTDLLDVSKLEAGKIMLEWNQLDLAQLVRVTASHFDSLAKERNITFTVISPDKLPAELDGEKIQRVLLNLLSNAFKYTPSPGIITVRLEQADSMAWLEVEDNGPGIPEHLREVVFERFRQIEDHVQRHFGGTGLGLSIVKNFVDLHFGKVTLSASQAGGALFKIALPLKAPEGTKFSIPHPLDVTLSDQSIEALQRNPSSSAPMSEIPAVSHRPLVMVVEDNADMNDFIVSNLRPLYRVCSAFNGFEGIELALKLRPDLIITDLMMPQMNGEEMIQELRRQADSQDIPIIVLTAKADDSTRVQLFQDGVQDYLQKPFSIAELRARVAGQITTRQRTLADLHLSAARLRKLAEIVEKIAAVRDLPRLSQLVCAAGRELIGADGVTLTLREQDQCFFVDENVIFPLWKGQRIPVSECISGWCILNAQKTLVENLDIDPRTQSERYHNTLYKSLSAVPIGRANPSGALTCYWSYPHQASVEELELQQALADATSVGLANLKLLQELTNAWRKEEQSVFALAEAQRLAKIGNWQWDIANNQHIWSEEVYHIYGHDPALPPPSYPEIKSCFTPESWDVLSATVEKCLADTSPYSCDAELIQPNGNHRWITARGEAIPDATGKASYLHGTVQDITERKTIEQEIIRLNNELEQRVLIRTQELSNANAELDAFAYAVSHDLRAPLRAMCGFSSALLEDYANTLNEDAKMYLQQIDVASRKMGDLIDALLALSRSTRGSVKLELIDLTSMAQNEFLQLQKSFPERQVESFVAPNLVTYADKNTMELVIRNLISNAWKYTSRTTHAKIEVNSTLVDGIPGFCVSDNGAGFNMEHANRLFQPFQRLHRQEEFPGIGIGLATVQRIIKRHGGVIKVNSAPGQGAVFSFSITDTDQQQLTTQEP